MVTGAGGSIGSELCRQISKLGPGSLLLLERYENALHELHVELLDRGSTSLVKPLVGDVVDRRRVRQVLEAHRPDVIFHAAAHKHVPLMEMNVCEAVKNNVLGTLVVAQEARRANVGRFVFVSSDKAVNPVGVMGATKRAGELFLQSLPAADRMSVVVVRFGNVLGSSGSVVPRFVRQIESGGPVTVTDPCMERYFMLVEEAITLVLHAAARGRSGHVLRAGDG